MVTAVQTFEIEYDSVSGLSREQNQYNMNTHSQFQGIGCAVVETGKSKH